MKRFAGCPTCKLNADDVHRVRAVDHPGLYHVFHRLHALSCGCIEKLPQPYLQVGVAGLCEPLLRRAGAALE